ncbi:nuclear transport factor 2 family protein [Actinomycetospora lemnae]|uniref:Nuclear transport factor 2 family protein n=1 Tax=Actinomycetospora lemnae TaxID=3019891 RepID=A0ABT5T0D4_9PSEU|nr:nuclear transport factor 2 family protein [Actinomycetospora sp. DW7H6]MDD7967846.1 nuclear transport factor 2 family protein [Actinomycetospora sp. DW7H6]
MTTPLQSSDVAVLEEGYRAFGRGDVAAVVALLDPQVAWTEAAGSPYAGTHVGPQAVVAGVFARLGQDWESFVPVPSEFLAAGSAVVVLGSFEGVHRATGRSMTSRFAHVYRLADGRVTAFESINDTHAVRRAMA